ncbi:hypothetical protein LshimejAT787_0306960 [Lyophyllum shimeji]|uniref:Uncharacterized protein n=1 Tax=Lyophyllum shimeji TaxID=47721 RepID=A0A9P3PJ58_LYOSH|nr:hypothetical protein LshimejAT787_0306960 [Lyophyllum shimeji]
MGTVMCAAGRRGLDSSLNMDHGDEDQNMSPSIQSTSEIPSYIVGNGYMVSKHEKMENVERRENAEGGEGCQWGAGSGRNTRR